MIGKRYILCGILDIYWEICDKLDEKLRFPPSKMMKIDENPRLSCKIIDFLDFYVKIINFMSGFIDMTGKRYILCEISDICWEFGEKYKLWRDIPISPLKIDENWRKSSIFVSNHRFCDKIIILMSFFDRYDWETIHFVWTPEYILGTW